MQNLIVFIGPQLDPSKPCWKIANLYMNRFTVDEEAAFELLGVYYLDKEHSEEKVKVTNSKYMKFRT